MQEFTGWTQKFIHITKTFRQQLLISDLKSYLNILTLNKNQSFLHISYKLCMSMGFYYAKQCEIMRKKTA
jgi:hypothetical protein